ncbi:MAG TPA: hypothetical protein PLB74_02260 [Candidatus Paceibacterota bacterium]|nr:hypothetical protein [Candidatus Paceibacterota bacterium]HOL54162.1 hypothetical protein [Candidatus Paceibacterota bacterium]HON21642.1 hypothetical protein [Candidatus Paceibacterota bacterium]HOV88861.1 hypothetical protein [Candidatus Paceibacterota bacterium]HPP17150.1 hypothetical protein [Candidatus Paceibacterota bacterium]
MEEIRPIKPDKDPLEEAREKEEELIKNAPPFTDFNEIEVDPVTHKIKIIEPKSEKQKIIEKEFEEEMRQLEAKYQSVMSEIKRTEDQMKARVQQGLSTDDRNRLEKMANEAKEMLDHIKELEATLKEIEARLKEIKEA